MSNAEDTSKVFKHRDIVIAYMDGKQIQYKNNSGEWNNFPIFDPFEGIAGFFQEDRDYRIKPKTRKYRVAQFDTMTVTVDTEDQAKEFASLSSFVRWLTNWVEYEV